MDKHEYFEKFNLKFVNRNTSIVEVGAGESSKYFGKLSKKTGAEFHSVDINIERKSIFENSLKDCNYQFHNMKGEMFFKDFSFKKISILYLDNYDWIWAGQRNNGWMPEQIKMYKERYNIDMNNMESTTTHLTQLMYAYPHLNFSCIVGIDDTYWEDHHGSFIGKGSACAYYLLSNGWTYSENIQDVNTKFFYRGVE